MQDQDNLIFPKYLSIQTTSLCNASCVFCPYEEIKNLFPKKIMEIGLYRKIIDECNNYKNIERIILYMNNEPLTDPYIIERINYAKEKVPWANIHILTNGFSFTEEISEKLINSKLDWIGISFHGIRKETIEKSMGIPFEVSFKEILNFIEKAKKKRDLKEFIMITFLKHKYLTDNEKEETMNFWKNKGIERISYFDGPISRAGNTEDLPKVYHKEKNIGCKSIWADEMLHIVEDGKVVLCCMDWRREVILGDLNKQGIYEVWNGKRKEIWEMIAGQKEMPDDFLCRRCEEAIISNSYIAELDSPDILFIDLPPWGVDTPALGIVCLSSYLKSKDIKTGVFDLNIRLYSKASKEDKHLWSMNYSHLWRQKEDFLKIHRKLQPHLNSFIEEIVKFPSKVLGFSLPTNCSDLILKEIVKKVKDADSSKIIILGGVSISIKKQRQDLLKEIKDYVDYCIVGEGEEALYKLILSIVNDKNKKEKDIKGVLNKERFFDETGSTYVEYLDKLPFPTFDEYDLYEYEIPNSVGMEFSRGCIGNCPFCDFKSVSPIFRSKSASYIFNQIKFYNEKYNINHISVCDAAVNGNIKILEEVCDLLIKNNLRINISALAIPREEMTEDLLNKMKKAGFYRLEYGVESGSNKILKAMRKIFTKEIAERVVRDTFRAGIRTYLYFIVGYPGEAEDDFDQTKEFLKRNVQYITMIKSINPLYIMAGSEIFYNYQKYNIVLPSKNSDREWCIGDKNTYSTRKKRVLDLKASVNSFGIPFTEEAESLEFMMNGSELSEEIVRTKELEKKKEDAIKKKEKTKADILLILCPMWDVSVPPLGISYLVSYLKSKGFFVNVLDINIENYADFASKTQELWKMENYRLWNDRGLFENYILSLFNNRIDDYVDKILLQDIDILGFSVNAANLLFSIELARRIKDRDPHKIIIFGGPHSRWFKTDIKYLEKYRDVYRGFYKGLVDIFVIGEGEKTLAEIIECYRKNIVPDNIPGTIFYKDRKYISQDGSNFIQNLDELPYPDFTWADLYKYTDRKMPILLSRGCIRKCTFCNDTFVSSRYRCRNAENVFKEIKFRINNERIDNFIFNDLILNGNLIELERLCDLLIEHKVDISYIGQFGVRKDMDRSLLVKLKRSGCEMVTYGVETFSNKVLKLMRKPYNRTDALKVLKDTMEAGLDVYINIIAGFPGEGEDEFNENVGAIKSFSKYIKGISSLAPCLITLGSDLQLNLKRYKIVYPRLDGYFRWYTEDGNNYNLRKRRIKIIESMMKESGLSIGIVNLYDIEDDMQKMQEIASAIKSRGSLDFLLINLPPWAQENPHIGVGYLCSYLHYKGLRPKVIDLNKSFYLNHPDFRMLWHVENKNFWSNKNTFPLILEIFREDIEKTLKEIVSSDCDIIGFSVVDPKERLTIELIKSIKQAAPNKKIILGGPATSTYEQRRIFLDNIADSVNAFVIGEGEETLFYLLDRFLNEKKIIDAEGCYVRNNGKWVHKERLPINSLDKIPFPTYEEFDMRLYGKSLLVEWSRGCRGKCAFCKNYRLFPTYRSKSVNWITNELRFHKERYNIEEFTVVDNILNGDLENLDRICKRIIDDNLKIRWTGQIAPHKNMDFEFFKRMRESGCYKLQIGLESGSNKVLNSMRKTFTSEVSQENIRFAKRAGIETEIFVMIGFPGEEDKDFKKTYGFVKRNRNSIDTIKSINTLHLIAGTEVYEKAYKNFNIKPLPKENWHYLWETTDGNNYKVRKKRAQKLLDLAYNSGIRVMETNVMEGKESIFDIVKEKKNLEERLIIIKDSINSLQELPQKRRIIKRKRSIFKWLILTFVSLYTFFYIIYFWAYMILRNRILLGGRRK